MPEVVDLSIRPYQSEGLEFLVNHRRAALFDEPGLGKSMQALLAMDDLTPSGRILVVATGDAVGVWQDEALRWLGEEASVYAGTKADPDALGRGRVVVTNYHRLSTGLGYGGWSGVIFDESQMLRNRGTRTLFKAVRAHFDNQRTGLGKVPAFFLSGTPIVKAAGDVWPILHSLDKKRWSSYWAFVHKYAITWHDNFGWHVEGVTNTKAMWTELSSVALRRTVAEVQPNLPPKIRQRVPLTMTPRQAKAYRELARDMYTAIDDVGGAVKGLLLASGALALETRLRQLLVSPRLLGIEDDGAALVALREVAGSHNRPLVVFTPFAEAIPYIMAAGEAVGRPAYAIQGGMRIGGIADSVKLYGMAARAGMAPLLVATVTMGKSWSVADVTHECYMMGFDWNATTMIQAESRLHRNEQKDTVFSRYFTHEKTHDQDALDVLAGKKRLADVILDRRPLHG